MTKAELETLADKYRTRAEQQYNNYQETGIQRYWREYHKAEELADALDMAVNAATEHTALESLRSSLLDLAQEAETGKAPEAIVRGLLSLARLHGIIDWEETT